MGHGHSQSVLRVGLQERCKLNITLPIAASVSDGCIASLATAARTQMIVALLPIQNIILTGRCVDEQDLIA